MDYEATCKFNLKKAEKTVDRVRHEHNLLKPPGSALFGTLTLFNG